MTTNPAELVKLARENIAVAILNYNVKHGVVQGMLSSADAYPLADAILAAQQGGGRPGDCKAWATLCQIVEDERYSSQTIGVHVRHNWKKLKRSLEQ